ncbi:MAG: hydroxymethylbilane synthase [Polyangiaceae bacterium]
MTAPVVTYATRRSALALAQSRAFVALLQGGDGSIVAQELQVVTSGDRIQDRPLADIGGKGLFVKEIEDALLEGRADFAVHSMKDMPGLMPAGLAIACVPRREDPHDVLVAPRHRTLDALPRGARVGTSSLRRARSLEALRPDLVVVPLRGNVDTRLRKVEAGECDAIVLARAGLLRLGLEGRATEVLALGVSLPAPGQGALAIECREDDAPTRTLLTRLHDPETAICVSAERGVLVALGGDCRTPLGAYAERTGDLLRLRAFVAAEGPSGVRTAERVFHWPADDAEAARMGRTLGDYLSQEMPHP